MAGGSFPKHSSHKPPPSSSLSQRKSRWESSSGAAATTTKNNTSSSNKPSDPKSSDPKHNKPPSNPATPKPLTTQSPAALSKPVATGQVQAPRPPPPAGPFPFPDLAVALGPPPPPSYGFHVLDRRTIALADGTVRSYFALPPDYQDLPHPLPRPMLPVPEMGGYGRFPPNAPMSPGGFRNDRDSRNPIVGPGEGSSKRKFRAEEERQKQFFNPNGYSLSAGTSGPFPRGGDDMRASKYMRTELGHGNVKPKHLEVDQAALKKAFLQFVKSINENVGQRRTYLEDGRQGRIQCVACSRFGEIGLVLLLYCYYVFISLLVLNVLLILLMMRCFRWFQLLMW